MSSQSTSFRPRAPPCQSCPWMDLTGAGAAATLWSIIMLLEPDMIYDLMAPNKRNYASGAAKRIIKKIKTEQKSGMWHGVIHRKWGSWDGLSLAIHRRILANSVPERLSRCWQTVNPKLTNLGVFGFACAYLCLCGRDICFLKFVLCVQSSRNHIRWPEAGGY